MTERELQQLVARARGADEGARVAAYRLKDLQVLSELMREILENIEPRPGACVMMSAMLEASLRDRLGIPAVCVAGDLYADGAWVFRCTQPLPPMKRTPAGQPQRRFQLSWKGHCWVEVGDLVVDVSLLRTSRVLTPNAPLRRFVDATFGPQRAAFASSANELPPGLKYRRRFVLTEDQVAGFEASEVQLWEDRQKTSSDGAG